ncbi:hypothetical protein LSAT2_025837 [Lamellibrachia satsuma]|nr:hypothetical protein LSAT2_025837 [Lamellibrachia satsuma]
MLFRCLVGEQLSQSAKYTKDTPNVRLLMQVYEACVHAVLHAITVYTQTLSASKAQEEARKELQEFCRQRDVPINPAHIRNTKYVEFQLDAVDSYSRVEPLTEGQCSLLVKVVTLTVYDVPSTQSKKSLGSVCFAESFLDSTIQVVQPDGDTEISGESIIHTRHIPYFLSWPAGEVEHGAYMEVEQQLKSGPTNVLGPCLCATECLGLTTLASHAELITDGQLYLCESGVAYLHPRHGAIVLPKPELAALHVYDGESMDAVALLIVSHKEHLNEFLPHQLHSNNNMLVLAFQPRTKAYKALFNEPCTKAYKALFNEVSLPTVHQGIQGPVQRGKPSSHAYKALFNEVLPLWKRKEEEPQVLPLSSLPEELQPIHSHLQGLYALSTITIPFGATFNFKKAKINLPDLSRFVEHFAASSVGKVPVPSRDLSCVLGRTEDQGSFVDDDELKAMRHLICGSCSNWVDFVKSGCEKSWAEVQADSFSFECRGCARMKELEVELEELRLLVVAMVGREQGSCASSSGGGTVDDKVGKDTRDARESSPQPGRKLRGGKVTGHRETGRKETGRKGTGGKTTRVKERGVGETGGKEKGVGETGGKTTGVKERGVAETGGKEKGVGETEGKTTGVKERGVGETRAKEWEVGETGGKGSGQNVMEGIERKSYSAAVIEGVRKRARVFVRDSIVRKTDRVLNKGDDVVVCLPGAKIEAITERLIISVLGGVPGSHKEHLAKCLMRLARDESRWAVVQHPLEERQEFSTEKLHAKLSAMWQAQHKHRPGTSTKKPRTLLVTPGFTDTLDVIQTISSHPDPEVAKHLRIGAVTVCVDETNTFMGEMYTLPNLLDQCAYGWVNNILLTGAESSQEQFMKLLMKEEQFMKVLIKEE